MPATQPFHTALVARVAVVAALCACRTPRPDDPVWEAAVADVTVDATADVAVDAPTTVPRMRVATFNTHRFFDTVCDSGRCGDGDYEELPTQAQFEARADQLARAIAALDVDAVALEEVETEGCLRALQSRLPGFVTAVMGEIGGAATVDVAVLSRDALVTVRRHRATPIAVPGGGTTVFAREFLEVHLVHGGHRVALFAAHFRSMVQDDPSRRLAEALAAHDLVAATAAELPDALVLLGGDLNDAPGSEPIDALEGDGRLVRVARGLGAAAGTYSYFGDVRAIDHIFLGVNAAYDARSVAPDGVRALWDARPARGYGGSDHAALRAEFTLADITDR